MQQFKHRHDGPELMDGPALPEQDLFINYKELHQVNRWLGGYRITLKGLRSFTNQGNSLSVLDAGCGGGDMLKVIAQWGRKKKIPLQLTGIDLSASAIKYAKQNCCDYPEIAWLQEDAFTHLKQGNHYDVIMNTLFMHHFSDKQIVLLLSLMKSNGRQGLIINDLHRHSFAFFSIKWITRLFSSSYLVKHDAPLSVLRSFRRAEWWELLSKALIPNAAISWEWAFRYLIVYRK